MRRMRIARLIQKDLELIISISLVELAVSMIPCVKFFRRDLEELEQLTLTLGNIRVECQFSWLGVVQDGAMEFLQK